MAKSDKKSDGKVLNQETYLGPKDIAEILKTLVADDMQMPTMIWGQPGIGKSEVCAQVAKELGRPFIDIRLGQMDPTDIRGIPFKSGDDMVWAPPIMFPKDPDDNSIIFFDELTSAPTSTQNSALQLILDRRVGEYKLPKRVAMIAAGNRVSDRTASNRMSKALANRFDHFNMGFVFEDWRDWAFKNNQHQDVIGFLSTFEARYANTFDPASPDNAYATPRTWSYASKILYSKLPEHLMYNAIAGAIGDGITGEFRRFRKFAVNLPKPEDILKGKILIMPEHCRKEISMQHAMSVSLTYKLKQLYDLYVATKENKVEESKGLCEKEWKKLAGNFAIFISKDENMDAEIAVMTLCTALNTLNISLNPKEIPEILSFFDKYKHLLNY